MSENLEEKTDYIICPVNNVTDEEKRIVDDYVKRLEATGKKAHYPLRDVEQNEDCVGLGILSKHRDAMQECRRVHIYWNGKSKGSLHDFGMAFMSFKTVYLINREDVEKMAAPGKKSFENVFLYLDDKAREVHGNPLD